MPSADQVPVKSPHSRMLWHKWVVLTAGSTGFALRAVRPPNLHITPGLGSISLRPERDPARWLERLGDIRALAGRADTERGLTAHAVDVERHPNKLGRFRAARACDCCAAHSTSEV